MLFCCICVTKCVVRFLSFLIATGVAQPNNNKDVLLLSSEFTKEEIFLLCQASEAGVLSCVSEVT